jgi:predicted MPP superfamily phosphohydrolase
MRPCIEALSRLKAPLGVFAVPGNHDHWDDIGLFHDCLKEFGIADATNTGCWIELEGERLRLGGVDDLWEGKQDLNAALGGASHSDCCILLCHNPDYVERLRDSRVSLVLSGHTHGGQVSIPGYYRHVPSRYGSKYLAGLVRTPWTQVYVSRGLGVSGPPVRFCCRPEINLLTLTAA